MLEQRHKVSQSVSQSVLRPMFPSFRFVPLCLRFPSFYLLNVFPFANPNYFFPFLFDFFISLPPSCLSFFLSFLPFFLPFSFPPSPASFVPSFVRSFVRVFLPSFLPRLLRSFVSTFSSSFLPSPSLFTSSFGFSPPTVWYPGVEF